MWLLIDKKNGINKFVDSKINDNDKVCGCPNCKRKAVIVSISLNSYMNKDSFFHQKYYFCKKCWDKECELRFAKTANKKPEEVISELNEKHHRYIKAIESDKQKKEKEK